MATEYNDPEICAERDRDLFFQVLDGKISTKQLKEIINLRHNKQWSSYSYNIGVSKKLCRNDCVYCYMKPMYARFKREMDDIEDLFPADADRVKKGWRKIKTSEESKVYMFPSSHDIFPESVEDYIIVAKKIIDAGHRVICVSKPRIDVITRICSEMEKYKFGFKFRFSISTNNEELMKVWESNAPSFAERFECLKYAFKNSYQTGVSLEPYIDDPSTIIAQITPFITDKIWIGPMTNYDKLYIHVDYKYIHDLDELYSKENTIKLVQKFRTHPKIFWKTGIMKICCM